MFDSVMSFLNNLVPCRDEAKVLSETTNPPTDSGQSSPASPHILPES